MIHATVIIAAYNQENTIARAIESVLAQDPGPFSIEILIIDDASTDSTPRICREYADRCPDVVRFIKRTRNGGIVASYSQALREAKGKYIADCAGDDAWSDSSQLQRQISVLEQNPALVLVHAPWYEVRPDGSLTLISPMSESCVMNGDELIEPLITHTTPLPIHLSATLYRAQTVRPHLDGTDLFNPAFGCEDIPLLCFLLSKGKIAYINTPSLLYSIGSGTSITSDASRIRSARFTLATIRMTVNLSRRYSITWSSIFPYLRRRTIHLVRTLLGAILPH
ncbi:MAG: glycosyltransferase [Paramuribaculum sp.]|nr:glycosyltransferase [Paramuribaculum sp.]